VPAITGRIEVNLSVCDPERSAAWYAEVFGMSTDTCWTALHIDDAQGAGVESLTAHSEGAVPSAVDRPPIDRPISVTSLCHDVTKLEHFPPRKGARGRAHLTVSAGLSSSASPHRDKRLTRSGEEPIIIVPMARIFTAERTVQGQALSSFGASACSPGTYLDHEMKPGRRDSADAGRPVVRW